MNRRSALFLAAVVAATVGGPASAGVGYLRPGHTWQVDVNVANKVPAFDLVTQYNIYSSSISASGRYVAFETNSALVPADTNEMSDIYVRDRGTGDLELISNGINGLPAIGPSPAPAVPARAIVPGANVLSLSYDPSISGDGRYVAFTSNAINLVDGDTNEAADVFVADRSTGDVRRVSIDSSGHQSSGGNVADLFPDSINVALSADGRYASFGSVAENLVPNDKNEASDVFVHNLRSGKTERVSVASGGKESNGGSKRCLPVAAAAEAVCPSSGAFRSSISGNGRFVAFDSIASDLVEGDTNDHTDVFVYDRQKKKTERVSVASDGSQAEYSLLDPASYGTGSFLACCSYDSFQPDYVGDTISGDGRYVVFRSEAINFVPNDTTSTDVFLHDRRTGETERISVTYSGGERPGGGKWLNPSISADGRFVAFNDGPEYFGYDAEKTRGAVMFVHDNKTGAIDLASLNSKQEYARGCLDAEPEVADDTLGDLSANGRFLSFTSCATNLGPGGDHELSRNIFVRDRGEPLVTGELRGSSPAGGSGLQATAKTATSDQIGGADLRGASIVARPRLGDLFARIDVAQMPGRRGGIHGHQAAGNPGVTYSLRFETSDGTFEARVGWLERADGTGRPSFELYRCDRDACSFLQALAGGYGTAHEGVDLSVPAAAVGARSLADLTHVVASSATGTFERPLLEMDRIRLR